jgi:hypothetical protein
LRAGRPVTAARASPPLWPRPQDLMATMVWTAPGSLEAVTSGKVGVHGVQEAASR